MKKRFLLIFVFFIGLMLVACEREKKPIAYGDELKVSNENYIRAIHQSKLIYEYLWDEGAGLFLAYDPEPPITDPLQAQGGAATLWGYGAGLTMAGSILKVDPTYQPAIDKAKAIVENLEQFRYLSTEYRYYTSVVGMGGEPYYDDNAWLVLGLYDIAKATGEDAYMQLSRDILDYVLSGESENGGIYWKETVLSRHTCSTGPAIVAALLHYLETNEESYLTTAKRLYDWAVRVLRDPQDGRYFDNATYDPNTETERVNEAKYTYNTGTMIWAGALLYQITGEKQYKEDALFSSEGALRFAERDHGGNFFYPSTPWFNVYLIQGFKAVAEIIGENQYLETIRTNLNFAWENAKDERGFVYKSWRVNNSNDPYVALLDAAGTAESYALLAHYDLNQNTKNEG